MSQDTRNRLRRLDEAELVPGQILRGHLRDRAGRILIRAGKRLTQNHLQVLRDREEIGVWVGADWDRPPRAHVERPVSAPPQPSFVATPDELLQALRRRNGPRANGRVRRHPRHACCLRVPIIVLQTCEGAFTRREFRVTTRDISRVGFAFTHNHFLHPGTVLFACFDRLPHQPIMKGIIRNCIHDEGRQHRVGVEFVNLDPHEQIPRFEHL